MFGGMKSFGTFALANGKRRFSEADERRGLLSEAAKKSLKHLVRKKNFGTFAKPTAKSGRSLRKAIIDIMNKGVASDTDLGRNVSTNK